MTNSIVVYGSGAIGSQVAGRLFGAGNNLTVIEPWGPQRQALKNAGITITDETSGETQRFFPPVVAPAQLLELNKPIDILLLAVKSFDTMQTIDFVQPYLASGGLVISMQNSINEEWIAPAIGPHRVLGAVILINASLTEPGKTTVTASVSQASSASGSLPGALIGEYMRSASGNASSISDLLQSVWPTETVDDLMQHRWTKLVTNTMMNTVTGISGLRSAAALRNPAARRLLITIGAETLRVADAEGYSVETVMADYAGIDILRGAQGTSDLVDKGLAARASLVSPASTTSMLQDVYRHRRTEVDYFSGLIAQKGIFHGIPTPACQACTDLLHSIENGLDPGSRNLDEVLSSIS